MLCFRYYSIKTNIATKPSPNLAARVLCQIRCQSSVWPHHDLRPFPESSGTELLVKVSDEQTLGQAMEKVGQVSSSQLHPWNIRSHSNNLALDPGHFPPPLFRSAASTRRSGTRMLTRRSAISRSTTLFLSARLRCSSSLSRTRWMRCHPQYQHMRLSSSFSPSPSLSLRFSLCPPAPTSSSHCHPAQHLRCTSPASTLTRS